MSNIKPSKPGVNKGHEKGPLFTNYKYSRSYDVV